jgi:hypothetical protein
MQLSPDLFNRDQLKRSGAQSQQRHICLLRQLREHMSLALIQYQRDIPPRRNGVAK